MITIQDMPDDVLEMIYSYLNIEDSVNTNIALCKRIELSSVTTIDSNTLF
jgi:hypothetical protein